MKNDALFFLLMAVLSAIVPVGVIVLAMYFPMGTLVIVLTIIIGAFIYGLLSFDDNPSIDDNY